MVFVFITFLTPNFSLTKNSLSKQISAYKIKLSFSAQKIKDATRIEAAYLMFSTLSRLCNPTEPIKS